MKKSKVVVTRTAAELAKALGLTPADGAEIALRSDLNSKIVEVVQRKGLTHAQVARLARTSRTRLTAIMNRNTKDISTDLLLRVLYSLGYTAKLKFQKSRLTRVLSRTRPHRAQAVVDNPPHQNAPATPQSIHLLRTSTPHSR
jgi:predicted XRE-type DNA-binding protein